MSHEERYRELEIRLRLGEDRQVRIEVIASPFDDEPGHENPWHQCAAPVSDDDLVTLAEQAESRVRVAAGKAAEVLRVPARLGTQAVGTTLFETLFRGEAESLYRRCLRTMPLQEHEGLRLRLVFDVAGAAGSEYLSRLPWELLYDPRRHRFLSRQRGVAVVRDLDWPDGFRTELVPAMLPLRVLLVEADPGKLPSLDLRAERERLHQSLVPLEHKGLVEIFRANTLDRMQELLKDRRIHVLHFMGHGGYAEDEGLGALFFEAQGGGVDQVDGDDLGEHLTGLPELRLVVFNSCHGARLAGDQARPARYGVAAGVLQRTALPAVLAMQYAISDDGAIAFAGRLYDRLARGDLLETAVSEARLRVSRESAEWATPVLFLKAAEGRLFRSDSEAATLTPRKLGVRTMNLQPEEDLGRDIPIVTDDHLDLRHLFEGRYIKDDALWAEEVFPELRHFLSVNSRGPRPMELTMAAHSTVAYAAGWILHVKSGVDLAVSQPSRGRGVQLWRGDDGSGENLPEQLWRNVSDIVIAEGDDVAVAISASRGIAIHVERYVRAVKLPVGQLLVAEVAEGGGSDSIAGGGHAARLADALAQRISEIPRGAGSRLHLFSSAPLAFLVFLGQLGRPFGRTQLYEHAFEEGGATYHPSLELPPQGEGGQPPQGW